MPHFGSGSLEIGDKTALCSMMQGSFLENNFSFCQVIMMNKMQDRFGTPCHIENHRRKSRDDADAYVPTAPDITAVRERGYGATFSHGKNVIPSKRTLKKVAANMIDCPDQKNRAGLYDTITIQDDDGNTYKQMLDFDANSIGDVYNQFRGKYLGEEIYFRSYSYKLIQIEKAGYQKRKSKNKTNKVKNKHKKIFRKKIYGFTMIGGMRINIIKDRHYHCCGERVSYKLISIYLRKESGILGSKKKLPIGHCKICGKYYMKQEVYNRYNTYKNTYNISTDWDE